MKKSVIIPVIPLVVSVILFFAGCEKENGLPVDGDGNHYNTVVIGTQVWLKENLKTTKYNNGVSIPLVTDDEKWASMTSAAYCWYDNSPEKYKENYGALYNWYVVNTGLLCPVGWHVPTKEEWETLINYLGGVNDAGVKLKDTKFWGSPNYGATNETGFSARPAGLRCSEDGSYIWIGEVGILWSKSLHENYRTPYVILLHHDYSEVFIEFNSSKKNGFSVRCIKNN
ncbi:MAG: fibrobacter succinogenes major paralogous domain-containing protein [Bacteroidales bacterium]|nr:fibrobacter succinogenes major paralogous domain-containing protein [Bacteroidales bacterium]